MPIPDYQSAMLPLLKLVADGQEHKFNDLVDVLSEQFRLTEEEKSELLPSGQSFLFGNRVGWARTYLKKAGLLDSPKRAMIVITERGKDVLRRKPAAINVKYLKQFPEFVEFQMPKKNEGVAEEPTSIDDNVQTTDPEETLELAYQRIRKTLSQDLLNRVVALSPAFFERLVVELLVKMGYGGSIKDAGKAIGKSGDEGIDGTIKEDKLGLDIIYIQAKKWAPGNVVGRPELHKFVGALAGQGAKKGVFITTSSFTKEASEYIPRNETKIVLIDGEQLTQLMIDYNLGVTVQQIYEVKRMDNDYFGE
ncbi:restriction endonuclease [Spirosoma radiotolerans]|uniref:Restriction endonuclease n=1 Tax=Spirosoma radiotolerans TaxID=1379870 RepID=A0A0E3ZXG9_9BACT|nr:restriction endonuclease [Spirosoma radiotolerans]AKD56215.1 restriction endonuclease [Spirosoma radiotolerans]